jgi:hypothetical protein
MSRISWISAAADYSVCRCWVFALSSLFSDDFTHFTSYQFGGDFGATSPGADVGASVAID